MSVDAHLTRHQCILRGSDERRFISYIKFQLAKKLCYPPQESITVTDTSAEVALQALLNHTETRLLEVQKEVYGTIHVFVKAVLYL